MFSTETSLFTLNCFIQHLAYSWHSNICYKHHNIHNQKMQRVNIFKRCLSYLNSFQPRRIKKETLTRCSLFFLFFWTTQRTFSLSGLIIYVANQMFTLGREWQRNKASCFPVFFLCLVAVIPTQPKPISGMWMAPKTWINERVHMVSMWRSQYSKPDSSDYKPMFHS